MRKIALFLIAAFILCASAHSKEKYEPFPGWNKLDTGAKEVWKDWSKGRYLEGEFNLFLKTNKLVLRSEKKSFKTVGFVFKSIIPFERGAIVTGKIKAEMLQCLASLEFVDYIEAAVPVTTKNQKSKSKNQK